MPKPWFCKDMDALGDADVTHIQTLAKRYKTSVEATVNRYVDLTDDVCAFVFAKDGVVRYVRPTRTFPRLSVERGAALPRGCASLLAPPEPLRTPTAWAEHDGSVWLQSEWGERMPAVLEQSMRQRDGCQVVLLVVQNSVEDDDEGDGDEELERKWTPRFR